MPSYLDGTVLFQLPYKEINVGTEIKILIYQPSIIYIAYEDSTSGSYGDSLLSDGWSLVTNTGETNTGCCTLRYVWRKYVTFSRFTTLSLPPILKTEFVFSLFAKTYTAFVPELVGASYKILPAFNDVEVWSDNSFKFSNLPVYLRGSMFFQLGYQSVTRESLLDITITSPSIIYIAYEGTQGDIFGLDLAANGWSILTSQGEIDTGCCTLNRVWKKHLLVHAQEYTTVSLPEIPAEELVFAIFVQDSSGFLPQLEGAGYELSSAFDQEEVWSDTNFKFSNLPRFLLGSYFFQLEYEGIDKGTSLEISVYKPSTIYILYETTTTNESFENDLRADQWSLVTDQGDINTGCCTMSYMWKKYATHNGVTSISLPAIPSDDFVFTILVQEKEGLLPKIENEEFEYGSLNLGLEYDLVTAVEQAKVWIDQDFQFTNLPSYIEGSIFFQMEYNIVARGSALQISLYEASTVYIAYESVDNKNFLDKLKSEGWLLVTEQAEIDTDCCTLKTIWKKYVTFNGFTSLELPPSPKDDFVFIIFIQEYAGVFPEINGAIYELATTVNQAQVWVDENYRFSRLPSYLEGSILFQMEYSAIYRGTVLEISLFNPSTIYLAYETKTGGQFETDLQDLGWFLVTEYGDIGTGCCTLNYIWKMYVTKKVTTKIMLPEIPQNDFIFVVFIQETEGFLPKLNDIKYDLTAASNGAQVWIDENYKFSNLPRFLDGSIHFQLEYQIIKRGTVIEVSVFKQSIIYIAYEDNGKETFGNNLKIEGWSLVTSKGNIRTGCCSLTYIWKKFVSNTGLTILSIPEIPDDRFVFTLFIQDVAIFLPELKGLSYQLTSASNGGLIWVDQSYTFSNLPTYLDGSVLFQLEYRAITQGKKVEVQVYKQSVIYIAYEASNVGNFEKRLERDGWILVTEVGEISTGCCTLTYVWKKVLTTTTVTIITLPEIPADDFILVIFIRDNADGKISEELTKDETDTDIDIDYGSGEGKERTGDDEQSSNQGREDEDDAKTPSFDEIAARPERCVEKIQMVEHTEYDDELICKHKYSEQCHQTYVTDYKPQQKQECVDSFVKKCFISLKKVASQENIEVCNTPLVCDGEGITFIVRF